MLPTTSSSLESLPGLGHPSPSSIPNSPPASSTLQCSFPDRRKMVKLRRLNGTGSHRPWPSFSAASFRRLLLDSMRCGASRRHRAMSPEQQRPLPPRKLGGSTRRLSELLKSAADDDSGDDSSSSSSGGSDEWETRRKMEAFEELCKVVKRLQFEEEKEKRKVAASEVRRLAKDDADARETLAMLGAIPALVGMLDMHSLLVELDFQVHVLYALLNLGIGNDM